MSDDKLNRAVLAKLWATYLTMWRLDVPSSVARSHAGKKCAVIINSLVEMDYYMSVEALRTARRQSAACKIPNETSPPEAHSCNIPRETDMSLRMMVLTLCPV